MAATQALKTEGEWTAMRRQVMTGNSRAMARQYLQSQIFTGGALAASNSNAFGGFTVTPAEISGYWATVSDTNPNARLNINPFTVMERGGFYRVWVPGSLWNGRENAGWNFQVRTRSPVAAGYTFVRQLPSPSNAVVLYSSTRIDMTNATNVNATNFFGYPGMPRLRVISVTKTNASDTNGYVGFMDIPEGAAVTGQFTNATLVTNTNIVTNTTTGLVTTNVVRQALLDIARDDLFETNSALRYNVTNNVDRIVLIGTNAATTLDGLPPLHVVVPTNNLSPRTLELRNSSDRRVYFILMRPVGFVAGEDFNIVATNTSQFRLGLTFQRQRIAFDVADLPSLVDLQITGGLRTDSDTRSLGAIPVLTPETDPRGLDFIGDRMMWLEDTRSL